GTQSSHRSHGRATADAGGPGTLPAPQVHPGTRVWLDQAGAGLPTLQSSWFGGDQSGVEPHLSGGEPKAHAPIGVLCMTRAQARTRRAALTPPALHRRIDAQPHAVEILPANVASSLPSTRKTSTAHAPSRGLPLQRCISAGDDS